MTVTVTGQTGVGAPFATDNTTTSGGRVVLVKMIVGADGTLQFVSDAAGLRLPVKAVVSDISDAEVKPGDSVLNALRTTIVGGAQVAALQIDNAPFNSGFDGGVPALFVYDDLAPAILTEGNAGIARMSKDRLAHFLGAPRLHMAAKTTVLTTTAETTILTAAAAGIYHDLTFIGAYNSNAATSVVINLRDTTGGPIVYTVPLSEKGGSNIQFGKDNWPQTTPATNWTAQLSVAVSTVYINVLAVNRVS